MSGSDPWDFSDYVHDDRPTGRRDDASRTAPTSVPGDAGWGDGSIGTPPPPSTSGSGGFGEAGGFGDQPYPSSGGTLQVHRAPVLWLAATGLAAVVGIVVAGVWGRTFWLGVVGWALSGLIGISLASVFVSRDTTARAGIYVRPSWVTPAYVACLVLCGIGVVVGSLRVALYLGRY